MNRWFNLCNVGPSGCGKTCLLDILAQRKTIGEIGGSCYIDHDSVTPDEIKKRSSYVKQEDIFYPTQTVIDAVIFQAQLRLPRTMSYKRWFLSLLLLFVILGDKSRFLLRNIADN